MHENGAKEKERADGAIRFALASWSSYSDSIVDLVVWRLELASAWIDSITSVGAHINRSTVRSGSSATRESPRAWPRGFPFDRGLPFWERNRSVCACPVSGIR